MGNKPKIDTHNPFLIKKNGKVIDLEKEMERMLEFYDRFNQLPKDKKKGKKKCVKNRK